MSRNPVSSPASQSGEDEQDVPLPRHRGRRIIVDDDEGSEASLSPPRPRGRPKRPDETHEEKKERLAAARKARKDQVKKVSVQQLLDNSSSQQLLDIKYLCSIIQQLLEPQNIPTIVRSNEYSNNC